MRRAAQQAAVEQARDDAERVRCAADDRDRSGAVERPREDGEAGERVALRLGEQLPGAVDGRAERALPVGVVGGVGQRGLRGHGGEQVVDAEQAQAGGSELDGERQAVQPRAQLAGGVAVLALEVDPRGVRALGEQLHRGVVRRREGERVEAVLVLAPHAQREPARRQQPQPGRGGHEVLEQGHAAQQVLHVVDHEQQLQRRDRAQERRLDQTRRRGRGRARRRSRGRPAPGRRGPAAGRTRRRRRTRRRARARRRARGASCPRRRGR